MARLALDQSPVGFSLKVWVFWTFFLDFTAEKAFTITEGLVAVKPYIGLFKCYRSFIVLSITLCNVYYYFHLKYEQLRCRERGCDLLTVVDLELKHSFNVHSGSVTWGLCSLLPKAPPCFGARWQPPREGRHWRECRAQEQTLKAWTHQLTDCPSGGCPGGKLGNAALASVPQVLRYPLGWVPAPPGRRHLFTHYCFPRTYWCLTHAPKAPTAFEWMERSGEGHCKEAGSTFSFSSFFLKSHSLLFLAWTSSFKCCCVTLSKVLNISWVLKDNNISCVVLFSGVNKMRQGI